MTLEASPKGYKRVYVRKTFKEYTYLGCPMTKNRSPWCFRLCKPHDDGTGVCGRVAPHGFKSYIQQGIEDYKRRQAESLTPQASQNPSPGRDA